ncbi:CRISPR-associated protein Cas2 [Porphyromonas macacae]|uniref:CRISPR-associated endoribonuclease Cas2 n=1 Tax=Porphyromonas macacae TaxID=28115 RepID=A0A379DK68_9PORP|nr:CRISPR-associated endonuclease Cas2 [Porphyromonas macacae]KGN99529.1 CRISPR-associated protein Cas2 [Porphyromonas macacae]SUB78736.1 CRISPR-associated endoribonuclease Cas2 [Porphyromonas macacae]
MLIISYDIKDDKLRNRFMKELVKNGAIRLQYSVYEFNNNSRLVTHILALIEMSFAPKFTADDSIVIFETERNKLIKYGNAIHRDKPVCYF